MLFATTVDAAFFPFRNSSRSENVCRENSRKSIFINAVIFVSVLTITILSPVWAFADPTDSYRYKLVMSADDNICGPLSELYNKLLASKLSKMDPAQLYATSKNDESYSTSFEKLDTHAFAAIGFNPLPFASNMPDGFEDRVYVFDFLGEGTNRSVVIVPRFQHMYSTDNAYLLKVGAVPRVVDRLASDEMGQGAGTHVEKLLDPSSIEYGLDDQQLYSLRKWPSGTITNAQRLDGTPAMGPGNIAIFLKNGSPYFVENDFVILPAIGSVPNDSLVLVFQLKKGGRRDVCYLDLPLPTVTPTDR